MRSRIPLILSRAHGALWVMQEPKVYAVFDFLERRSSGVGMTKAELLASGIRRNGNGLRAMNGRPAYRLAGSVAVLPIKGVIADHAGMEMDISGGTSTKAFARAFDEALNAADVSGILFDCDSPGGTVEGVPELAAKIFAARGRKPIVASVNAHCHSGAYWLASQCDSISITPSGEAGDIGVMTVRRDYSAAEAKAGIRNTLIKAGKYKGEGNPSFAPEDAELEAQRVRVEQMYDLFAGDVARGRAVGVEEVINGMGEGRSLGAKLALKAGLVDRIETIEQTLGRLSGRSAPRRSLAARQQPSAERIAAAVIQQLAAESGDEGSIEECPECGAPMEMQNGAQVCPECGYTAPGPDENDDASGTAHAAAVAASLSASAGRTVVIAGRSDSELVADAPVPDTPITTKQESQAMPDNTQPDLAKITADAIEAAKLEAKKRITDITELCALAGVDAAKVNEFLASDLTAEAVRSKIVAEQRASRAANPNIRVGADRDADRPFDNLGQNLQAIAAHFSGDANVDKRLYAAVTTGGASANVGADGGFAIQKDFTTELFKETIDGGDLLSKCDTNEIGADADGLEVMYIDETSRATGSRWGGVQVYRGAEADTPSAKKPKFGKWECRLEDIIGLAYVTERLLKDASSLASVFSAAFADEITFTAENELVRGTGVGQMAGIIGHNATVSVAKESGQTADTIWAENIMNMWKCVHPRSRLRGSWYVNVECEPQLQSMQIGTGTSAQLVYMPPGGLANAQYGTIYGRPVVPIEYASGLGDVGDIFFADWSKYKVITKGGVQSDESIHVGFIKNERTFRWITRINGAPKLKAALTPFKATDSNLKLSPFVTLAAR